MVRSVSRRGVYLPCRVLPGTGAAAREGGGTRVGVNEVGGDSAGGEGPSARGGNVENEKFKGMGQYVAMKERGRDVKGQWRGGD